MPEADLSNKTLVKSSLLNLSVEEENLAAIPFAVLERRVGKCVSKLEIQGTKTLPNGRELRVNWQVQGNSELGLPTEQDLDIFVALGVLTFRNNFAKTVSFTGRELARVLNISGVHGKFYQRLKLAMDRFIPLRFRAIAETDRQEEVKWLNVFQEASFSLDRETGRCTGSITWTDKIIQSMDSGFFRMLDAGRYMELDGITAKHLYRFLTVAFERTEVLIIDSRTLAKEHLGIVNVPKYFSRLMQTLEPAFEQLRNIEVLASYQVYSAEEWRIALRRHPAYMPERNLLLESGIHQPEMSQAYCARLLVEGGFTDKAAMMFSKAAASLQELYAVERSGRILAAMRELGVMPHVGAALIRRALEAGATTEEGTELLDWCEIAIDICHQKQQAGQALKNAAGLVIKIAKDPAARARLVGTEMEASSKRIYREREQLAIRQHSEAEERNLFLDYESFCRELACALFTEMSEVSREALRKEKSQSVAGQSRLQRLSADRGTEELDELILQDLARREAPPFEKWRLRQRARQAVLPFELPKAANA